MNFPFFWRKREPSHAKAILGSVDMAVLRADIAKQMQPEIDRMVQDAASKAREDTLSEVSRALSDLAPVPTVLGHSQGLQTRAYSMDRPITFSTPQAPTRRPGTAVSTDTLRQLADCYDILRSCINQLKREVFAVPIRVVPRDQKDKRRTTIRRQKQAEALFTREGPVGGIGTLRRHFEARVIEDLCIIGAGAVFHERARGGWVRQSVDVDAATIRVWVDAHGWTAPETGPGSENAYEQWVYGVLVARFSHADLSYDGLYPMSYNPYFKSPVEYLIDAVETALRSNMWNKGWLTDGNSPDQVLSLPSEWAVDDVIKFAEFWDSLTADGANSRHKTRFLPGGSGQVGIRSRKDQDFAGLDLWLLRRTCSIMGVQPASIGFVGEQYKVSQDASLAQTTQFGTGAILSYRKEMYDDFLKRYGFGEFEVINVIEQEDTAKNRAETNAILIESGQRTINECRKADGEDSIEGGDELLVKNTLVPLSQSGKTEPETVPPTPGEKKDLDPSNPPGKNKSKTDPLSAEDDKEE